MCKQLCRRISFEEHGAVVALGRFSSATGREALDNGIGVLNDCGFAGQIAQRASVCGVFVAEDFAGGVLKGGRGAEDDIGNLTDVGRALTVEKVLRRVIDSKLRLRGLDQRERAENGGGGADQMLGIGKLLVDRRKYL